MSPGIGSAPHSRARRRRATGPTRDRVKARLLRIYTALERRFGPQRWWPGRTPFEVAVGAVLTQHTAWTNAARAVAALRARRLLSPRRLARRGEAEVARAIRAAGTPRVKARRLRALTRWLLDRFGGTFAPMRRLPLAPLRRELLAVPGIGPETADAILLYAAERPVFVADAYARRVLVRHRLLRHPAGYDEARAFLEARLPSDPALFNEYHALLVRVGKTHCRTVPRCEGCPLRFDLRGRAPAR
jgi:endonuclease-3 related protein